MKHWPTSRTLLNGVTQSALDQWRYWLRHRTSIAKTIVIAAASEQRGIKLGPWTTKAALSKQLDDAEKQAEICRMICREQDIHTRWIMRQFNRQHHNQPDTRWQPTPMLMDQYIERETRKLREDL